MARLDLSGVRLFVGEREVVEAVGADLDADLDVTEFAAPELASGLAGLQSGSVSLNLQRYDNPAEVFAWRGPSLQRVSISHKRGQQPFRAVAEVVGSSWNGESVSVTFALSREDALRYARMFSPKWRARMRRLHTTYPKKWRRKR